MNIFKKTLYTNNRTIITTEKEQKQILNKFIYINILHEWQFFFIILN